MGGSPLYLGNGNGRIHKGISFVRNDSSMLRIKCQYEAQRFNLITFYLSYTKKNFKNRKLRNREFVRFPYVCLPNNLENHRENQKKRYTLKSEQGF